MKGVKKQNLPQKPVRLWAAVHLAEEIGKNLGGSKILFGKMQEQPLILTPEVLKCAT
jgi:hypothetical protein